MNQGKYVFAQLFDLINRYDFDSCVDKYNGNFRVKSFTCWEQFVVMSFAQLSFRESLRDIECCLNSVQNKLYHFGVKSAIARSTVADANENRNWQIYADIARTLMRAVVPLYKGDNKLSKKLKSVIYAFDSTTISLCRTQPNLPALTRLFSGCGMKEGARTSNGLDAMVYLQHYKSDGVKYKPFEWPVTVNSSQNGH